MLGCHLSIGLFVRYPPDQMSVYMSALVRRVPFYYMCVSPYPESLFTPVPYLRCPQSKLNFVFYDTNDMINTLRIADLQAPFTVLVKHILSIRLCNLLEL